MPASKTYIWHKIAESTDEFFWQENNLCEVTVKGKTICVGRNNHELFACASKCPHAGGQLSRGFVDALGNIVCPLHRYKFSLQNGRNVSGEGYYLKTYPLEVRTDGVYLGFEDGSLFSWFK
jgi:nitrite reductase/ring-hydroxylating ferredoxin subunit